MPTLAEARQIKSPLEESFEEIAEQWYDKGYAVGHPLKPYAQAITAAFFHGHEFMSRSLREKLAYSTAAGVGGYRKFGSAKTCYGTDQHQCVQQIDSIPTPNRDRHPLFKAMDRAKGYSRQVGLGIFAVFASELNYTHSFDLNTYSTNQLNAYGYQGRREEWSVKLRHPKLILPWRLVVGPHGDLVYNTTLARRRIIGGEPGEPTRGGTRLEVCNKRTGVYEPLKIGDDELLMMPAEMFRDAYGGKGVSPINECMHQVRAARAVKLLGAIKGRSLSLLDFQYPDPQYTNPEGRPAMYPLVGKLDPWDVAREGIVEFGLGTGHLDHAAGN